MSIIDPNKIKWQKVEANNIPVIDFTVDKELIGTFIKKEEHIKPNDSNIYTFKNLKGEEVCFWGNTLLDSRLATAEIGDLFKIVYLGKAKSKDGQREYHNFDIFHGKGETNNSKENIPVVNEAGADMTQEEAEIVDEAFQREIDNN